MYHSNCRSGACICVTAIIGVLAAAAGGLLYAFVSLPDLLYAVIAMLAVAAVVLLFAGLMAVLFCCCGHTGCANSCVRACRSPQQARSSSRCCCSHAGSPLPPAAR